MNDIFVAAIQDEIASGYINEQAHPSAPLRILNYSQRAQFDWRWNAATMQCRGLIVDADWNVVARPFEKFFSFEQLGGDVPVEPFEAYAACAKFGADKCRRDRYSQSSGAPDFPVLTKDGRIASSLAMSQTLTQLEAVSVDFVFVDSEILDEAKAWLHQNLQTIITPTEGPNDE